MFIWIYTHTWIVEQLFDNPTGFIADYAGDEVCKRAFLAGSMVPDITVAYYFAEGGSKYRATHNWNFQYGVMSQANTKDEQAFAYGIASHLIADSISHTMCIPERIHAYHIPNWLIHPLTEKKYDSLLAQANPGLKQKSKHMLDAVLKGEAFLAPGETLAQHNARADRYIKMIEGALMDPSFDVEKNLIRLAFALDSFYQDGKAPSGGGIFALYPAIDALTDLVYPLAGGGMDQVQFYVDKALQENRNTLTTTNWGTHNEMFPRPHGFDELTAADKSAVAIFDVLFFTFIIMMFALPIFLMWWRREPRFLIFIPLLFFIGIFILLIIYLLV